MNNRIHKELEFDKVLSMLSEYALSNRIKERILRLEPYLSEAEAVRRMDETTHARRVLESIGKPPLASMVELDKIMSLIGINSMLNPDQLESVAQFASTCSRMKSYLKRAESSSGRIASIGYSIDGLKALRDEIERCIRGGMVDDRASSELAGIRRKIAGSRDQIKNKLNSLLRSNEKYFSEGFIVMRGGRYTLAVRREYRNQISGTVVDKSNSGNTCFIEPSSVSKIQQAITSLEIEEDIEVNKILYTLTAMVEDSLPRIKINIEAMETLDFVFAKAKLSRAMDAVPADITTGDRIVIRKGRHPLLNSDTVVPLDFGAGGEGIRGVIITGPNTGGKTVVLKTVGLFSLMAQCGLHIPAEAGEFCMRNMVLCDIGDGQSITENLSTFSSHMTRIISILETADEQSLVLLDELGSGTDPTEGMGIATVVLEEILKTKCLLVATTHYPEIKEFARNTEGLVNAKMAFDRENLMPLYRLEIGEAGESCALYIARRLGLSMNMVERAHHAAYHDDRKRNGSVPSYNPSDFAGIPDREKQKKKRVRIQRKPEVHQEVDLSDKFGIGDSVIVHPGMDTGIVFQKVDDHGRVGVMIKRKKYLVSHKRVELHIPASELYPDDYDFSIIFDTVTNRKARKKMTKRHNPELTVTVDEDYEEL